MLLGIALLNLSVQVPLLMLTIINQQVISILTLAGSISYDKNLVIELWRDLFEVENLA